MIHDNRVQRRDYGGDFSSDRMTFTETRSYEPGIGRVDHPLTLADAEYYHTDMLGSTRIMTDLAGNGIPDSEAAYTAFGEVVPGSGTHRFGYAGAHGYQAPTSDPAADPYATDFPFLHVGHRYYDPATGRFLQRDPIGIEGGLNVYAYVGNDPLSYVDPSGLGKRWDKVKDKLKDIWEAIKKAKDYIVPGPGGEMAGALDCIPDAVRGKMNDAKRKHRLEDHPDEPDLDCPRCKEIDKIVSPPKNPRPPAG